MTRSSNRRGPWLPDEDQTLLDLVHKQGPNNWVRISQHMQHRTPKQCRERFHQNLKPTLNHDPITHQEGEYIEQLVGEMGKRWAEIARRLGNRSDNAVKNWWNGSMNRRKRNGNHRGPGFKNMAQRNQPISAIRPQHLAYDQSRQQEYRQHGQPSPASWSNVGIPRANATATPISYPAPPTPGVAFQMFDPRLLEADRERHLQYAHVVTPTIESFSRPMHHPHHSEHVPVPNSLPRTQLGAPQTLHLSGGRQGELPLISPMGSEASFAPSINQPPSLISDRHSTYSVSPKTVPSPRPTMLAPIDTRTQWQEQEPRRGDSLPLSRSLPPDEGYASAMTPSHSVLSDGKQYQPMASYHFGRSKSQNDYRTYQDQSIADMSPNSAKDARMNVSSLLH